MLEPILGSEAVRRKAARAPAVLPKALRIFKEPLVALSTVTEAKGIFGGDPPEWWSAEEGFLIGPQLAILVHNFETHE